MTKRVLILVEGRTEERFVKDVLAPALCDDHQIYARPTLLTTKRVKDGTTFKGGVTSFPKYEGDVKRLLHGAGGALVTTMIDYYALPGDFPGMASRPATNDRGRVVHVEQALLNHFGAPTNFLPYLMRHEFEALLFSDAHAVPGVLASNGDAAAFAAVCAAHATPEDINERPDLAPSRRMKALFPGYRKAINGPSWAAHLGLQRLRDSCPHFAAWYLSVVAF